MAAAAAAAKGKTEAKVGGGRLGHLGRRETRTDADGDCTSGGSV